MQVVSPLGRIKYTCIFKNGITSFIKGRTARNDYDFTKARKLPYASMVNKDKQLKPIPHFKTEISEKKFWEDPKTDATEYFDIYLTTPVNFPNLKLIKKL